jgi:hypothetical protein
MDRRMCGSRSGLDKVEKREILPPPGLELTALLLPFVFILQ